MSLDRLVGDSRAKLGTVGLLVVLLLSLHNQVGDVSAKIGKVEAGLVQAQKEQALSELKNSHLEARIGALEIELREHVGAVAAPLLRWSEAMRRWEADNSPAVQPESR